MNAHNELPMALAKSLGVIDATHRAGTRHAAAAAAVGMLAGMLRLGYVPRHLELQARDIVERFDTATF